MHTRNPPTLIRRTTKKIAVVRLATIVTEEYVSPSPRRPRSLSDRPGIVKAEGNIIVVPFRRAGSQ